MKQQVYFVGSRKEVEHHASPLSRLLDYVIPWLGGNYKLFLRQYDDEKVLIWQGNNTSDYEGNLALLESAGLTIA